MLDIKKIIRIVPLQTRQYIIIIIDNIIPLIGYFAFDWTITEIFLFYAVELCAYELIMVPRVVIFVFISDEYFLESTIKKIGLSISWLLFRLLLFCFTMMFLLHSAFAISATTASFKPDELLLFIGRNKIFIVYIFVEYIYSFYRDYIKEKEYEVLDSELQLKEISIFYVILLTVIGIVNVISVGISLDKKVYQVFMMFIIFIIKTMSQLMLRKGKNKYF